MTTTQWLNRNVKVIIDRPLGSKHPRYGFVYPINYGYVPNTLSGDGFELDAYVLGVNEPLDEFEGMCVAVIRRLEEDDDKIVLVKSGVEITNEEILAATHFQEKYFTSQIYRNSGS